MSAMQWIRQESRERAIPESAAVRAIPGVTDILTIGTNPTLGLYLSDLFRRFGWSVARTRDCAGALEFLQANGAAVVVCEESLADGGWQDAAERMASIENAPPLIVLVESERLSEVVAHGGFDVLTRPLREADVVWTIATAWDHWMKRFERSGNGNGGIRCSDA